MSNWWNFLRFQNDTKMDPCKSGYQTNGVGREEICISGIAGRFPESDSVDEFKQHLLDGVNLITEDDRRWPAGIHGLPKGGGKIRDLTRFDAGFFGVNSKLAAEMDPQLRMLMEVTYEAIIDAGVNPNEIKGTKTGVFIGMSNFEASAMLNSNTDDINGYALMGSIPPMLCNRISYAFDLKGPSYTIDTACSTALYAINEAVNAIRSGQCDSVIVGAANITLRPEFSLHFHRVGALSPDGACKVFDASADGFIRSESVVVMYIQKASAARRVYTTILGTKTNNDGYKEEGIMFPSGEMQHKLISDTYLDAGVDPNDVTYAELHGTGTKVGDPQETNAVAEFFCKNRKEPLLIGSVKSNIGHTERVAGFCGILKIVIAMETGTIPANLHFKTPNPSIPGLLDGRLKVVAKNEPWNGAIAAISSFGLGGSNAHTILRYNTKSKLVPPTQSPFPRLVAVSGRTQTSVETFLNKIEKHRDDEELLALVHQVHSMDIRGHPYRGYKLLGKEKFVEVAQLESNNRPVWFMYPGLGSQYPGMGKSLMKLDVFRRSIEKSAMLLMPYGVDLVHLITEADKSAFGSILNSLVAVTGIQIALTDVLTSLQIQPDGIVGHSNGEVVCSYADGSLTAEQSILMAYFKGRSFLDNDLIVGAMASVGLSWDECKRRCPPEIVPACHNSADNVTISGPVDAINKFVEELKAENVFVKTVLDANFPYHSQYVAKAGTYLIERLKPIIPNPKRRSSKWISSSAPSNSTHSPIAQFSSSEYHANNMVSPVLFYEALQHIPKDAIVIEIAPHGIFQSILKRTLGNDSINISLVDKKHADNVKYLLSSIGIMYNAGMQPQIDRLYPPVSYPVGRGTPGLSSMIEWDHSDVWDVPSCSNKNSLCGELIVNFDLNKDEDKYISGHTIDGRILFPAAGYLTIVWQTFAKLLKENYEQLPVVMEDVVFHRATIIPKDGRVTFLVHILDESGAFEIGEGGSVVASGRIYVPEDISKEFLHLSLPTISSEPNMIPLTTNDIYKEFGLRGYEYSGLFKGILEADNIGTVGKLRWDNNWISFLDTVLQFGIIGQEIRDLFVPTKLTKTIIDPKRHSQCLSESPKRESIAVNFYRDVGIAKSGGVEFRGMKVGMTSRRPPRSIPSLEKYQFVPFENTKTLSKQDALSSLIQLVLENISGELNVRVCEISNKPPEESTLAGLVTEIIEKEAVYSVDYSVVPLGSRSELAHVMVLSDVLLQNKAEILKEALGLVKNLVFVLLERPKHPIDVSLLLDALDLDVISTQITDTNQYVLLRKPVKAPSACTVVNVSENNFAWVEQLKCLIEKSEKDGNTIYLVSQGVKHSGLVGMMNCLRKEPGGKIVRAFDLQDGNAETFSLSSPKYAEQIKKGLVQNVLRNGVWGTYRHLVLDQVESVQTEHAYVNTLTRGDLSSLRWIKGPLTYHRHSDGNGPDLCTIYYSALNFRDVMLATGKLALDALPTALAGLDCVLGIEFSGRDSKGRRIMGMKPARCVATSVLLDGEGFVWEVPDKWSLEEAATIPIAYFTSYYALFTRGCLKPGETILIHAGAGGVGMAAISLALHIGCTVFTTVGSQIKRDAIKKMFPEITDDHIYNSRDTTFEQLVMSKTKGRGVDVVLNSLAGDKLQASLRCLADNGRFLEIGKLDIAQDTPLGMNIFLKNITFYGIFLDFLLYSDFTENETIIKLLVDGIANGAVRPLPRTVYDTNQVEDAFRFMASGKHLGKVLLKVKDEENHTIEMPKPNGIKALRRTYMDPAKSYIVVGGLGGFGLELANWLIKKGATKIVLMSRSGIKTGYQTMCVRRWRKRGTNVVISTTYASTKVGAEKLLKEALESGPVGGIFNLAVVLKDSIMINQTDAKFLEVCRPKIEVTKQLDFASRKYAPELDYFVCFSSIACGRGNAGQTNYGWANSVMEKICEERNALGLPGMAIQWGAIGDVGLAMETMGNNDTVYQGHVPQRMPSCLDTIDIFLQQPHAVISSRVLAKRSEIGDNTNQTSMTQAVANILGIKDAKTVAQNTTLTEFGMDSLMAAEIKQVLEKNYDLNLTAQKIRSLTFKILAEIEGNNKNVNTIKSDFKGDLLFMPEHTVIKMISKRENNNKNPIFLVHALEGNVSILENLAKQIDATVYGLQCTIDAPLASIEELANFYISHIKKIQNHGPYTLVGYSLGATVTFEIAIKLETEREKVKMFHLDGSHSYLNNYVNCLLKRYNLDKSFVIENENSTEAALLYVFICQSKSVETKTIADLEALKSFEDRLAKTAEHLIDCCSLSKDQIMAAAKSYYHRLMAGYKYKTSSQFNGPITLFKADSSFVEMEPDFGLTSVCKQKVEIHTIEGSHQTILFGNSANKIADIINGSV